MDERWAFSYLCIAVFLVVLSGGVSASQLMSLQGNAKNSSGSDIPSGNLTVTIWDSMVGGNLVYNSTDEFYNNITDGKYDVVLGSGAPLDLEYGGTYYMGLVINAEQISFGANYRQQFQSGVGLINSTFLNITNINATGNISTGGWFSGFFNILLDSMMSLYFTFDGLTFSFNESRLNETIDSRISLNGGSGGNASLEFNPIVGFTASSYTGNLSNSTTFGYVRANQLCAEEYSGSHFCLKSEVLKTIANGNYTFIGTAWFQNGPPGYTANADDCAGWTTGSNTFLGPFWNWDDNSGAGVARLTNCAQTKPLMCCG